MMASTHEPRDGRATPDEQFHIFTAENLNELAERMARSRQLGSGTGGCASAGRLGEAAPTIRGLVGDRTGRSRNLLPREQPRGAKGYEGVLPPEVVSVVGSGFGHPVTRPRRRPACTSETVTSSVKVSCGACPRTDPVRQLARPCSGDETRFLLGLRRPNRRGGHTA